MATASFHLDVARFNQRLSQFLRQTQGDAERTVFETALDVLSDTVTGWPRDTGISADSWWGPQRVGPAAFQIGNPWGYARVIESGGYRGVGPKTHRFGPQVLTGGITIPAGIYPRQKPAAPLRRALAKRYGAMSAGIRRSHQRHWGR